MPLWSSRRANRSGLLPGMTCWVSSPRARRASSGTANRQITSGSKPTGWWQGGPTAAANADAFGADGGSLPARLLGYRNAARSSKYCARGKPLMTDQSPPPPPPPPGGGDYPPPPPPAGGFAPPPPGPVIRGLPQRAYTSW